VGDAERGKPRVTFVLGLCGAGKSTRARELAGQGFVNFDEKATGRPVHPDLATWPTSAYPDFLAAVGRGRDCVVTEIFFYRPDAQRQVANDLKAVHPEVVIEWECFDHADMEVANHNCRHDPERTVEGVSANLEQNEGTARCIRSGVYQLPPGTKVLRTVRLQRTR
jgi:hypothetical protein